MGGGEKPHTHTHTHTHYTLHTHTHTYTHTHTHTHTHTLHTTHTHTHTHTRMHARTHARTHTHTQRKREREAKKEFIVSKRRDSSAVNFFHPVDLVLPAQRLSVHRWNLTNLHRSRFMTVLGLRSLQQNSVGLEILSRFPGQCATSKVGANWC